jgi:hypothetical protein
MIPTFFYERRIAQWFLFEVGYRVKAKGQEAAGTTWAAARVRALRLGDPFFLKKPPWGVISTTSLWRTPH